MPVNPLSKLIYTIRDTLWVYPDAAFFNDDALTKNFRKFYLQSRPYSHFASSVLVIMLITSLAFIDVNAVLSLDNDTFIEGQVVGVDAQGNLQKLGRVSPLVNTTVQAEKDLIELIYQSLLRVNQNGKIEPVLIEDYVEIDQGEIYRFKLKDNVYWQDGEKLSTRDVNATFNLLKELETDPKTSTIYSRAAVQLNLEVIDDLSFELHFKPGSVIPGFFEAIAFKILPAHRMSDLNARNITTTDPLINRKPIGTGPYKLVRVVDNTIILTGNKYYDQELSFNQVLFKLYPDEKTAVDALRSGQIHALSSPSIEYLEELRSLENVEVHGSNYLSNQYWALYFNLSESGPAFFKDQKVRAGISSAVNRQEIIAELEGFGKEALGPIPDTSFAYLQTSSYTFDSEKSKKLLDEAGWKLNAGKTVRSKDGVDLKFDIVLVDNLDRRQVAEVIQRNLADVGVEVTLTKKSLEDVAFQHIIPRSFEMLLYGVQTFTDPDRYNLFHSSQAVQPGLNIASYTSPSQVSVVRDSKIVKIPEVDDALDNGRKFINVDARKKEYNTFQRVLAADVPVIFLYHPVEVYVVNKRVKNINLVDLNNNSERFRSIMDWEIDI